MSNVKKHIHILGNLFQLIMHISYNLMSPYLLLTCLTFPSILYLLCLHRNPCLSLFHLYLSLATARMATLKALLRLSNSLAYCLQNPVPTLLLEVKTLHDTH